VTGLFKWAGRNAGARELNAAAPDVVAKSKVLPRFLAALARQPSPVLVDLGPVVGSNISFFGDRLACKIHVEDVFADVEAHAKRDDRRALAQMLQTRLKELPGTVDGILCWDLFDFLDRPSAQFLARSLSGLLGSGGVLHGLFGTTAVDLGHYTRFVVDSESTLRLRPYPATPVRRHVLMTRDITKMFEGLAVAESVLLKSRSREILFRKP
jgi:hypothetical protein